MIKQEREKNGNTCYLCYFQDWLEFVGCAERILRESRNLRFNGYRCASLETGKTEWTGTESLSEAVELARHGWPEGRSMVREMRERLTIQKLLPHSKRIIREVDTAGDEPDVDLYLQGEPEHMVTLREAIEYKRGKVLRFLFNRSCSAYVKSEQLVRKGLAVLLAIETLTLLGFSTAVSIVFSVSNRGYRYYDSYIPVLHAGDPVNLDTLAFMLIHPSVLRRLGFAAEECESAQIRNTFGFMDSGGYGKPCEPSFPEGSDLYLKWDEGLLDSDDEIVPFAWKILGKVGVTP